MIDDLSDVATVCWQHRDPATNTVNPKFVLGLATILVHLVTPDLQPIPVERSGPLLDHLCSVIEFAVYKPKGDTDAEHQPDSRD